MSEPKVQLVDPQGNMSVTGMSAVGVITASSFDGISNSSATSITGTPDLDVGIVTATSFVGQGKGHAAGLAGTPELNLGVTTATSFVGDATGKAAGLTGTPNLTVGLVTATGFAGNVTGTVTGNVTGLAASITPGSNLGVGVCTAIQYHGDGSGLTGAGSSAYIAQNITATGAETIIDLSYGNLIYYKGEADTTVGFASTSAAEQITFIRETDPSYSISYSTGGVDFDGSGDKMDLASSSDFAYGTGDFTVECWIYARATTTQMILTDDGKTEAFLYIAGLGGQSIGVFYSSEDGGPSLGSGSTNGSDFLSLNQWYHIAYSRSSGTSRFFVNGDLRESASDTQDYGNQALRMGADPSGGDQLNGIISNLRIVKGTAVYTSSFVPPSAALTNITNTKLLCCQSDSSATTAAVTPGTITAYGDPTAGAQTISTSGSLNATITWPDRVKWNNDTTPTLVTNTDNYTKARQIFRFTTVDTGLNYNAWEEMVYNVDQPNTLFSWGSNSFAGQLGVNDKTSRSSPIQVGTDTNWTKIKGFASSATTAIKTDGTLWSWGYGGQGILAQNNRTSYSSPIQVGTETTWGPFSSGDPGQAAWAMVQKTDGTLWSWGGSDYGQLGLNSPRTQVISSPAQITGTTWSKSMCSSRHGVAIKTDGSLWTWGANYRGQLGNNLPDNNMRSAPIQVGTNTTWSKLAGGYNNSAVIKTDNTLWVWGTAQNGALGLNQQAPSNNSRSSPTQLPGSWSNGMLFYPNCATFVKTDGTLWSWGYNDNGTLGLNQGGPGNHRSSPTQVGTDATWDTLYSGNGNSMASKTDGTFWVWGNNDNGSLGLNNQAKLSSPTQLTGTWFALAAGEGFSTGLKPFND